MNNILKGLSKTIVFSSLLCSMTVFAQDHRGGQHSNPSANHSPSPSMNHNGSPHINHPSTIQNNHRLPIPVHDNRHDDHHDNHPNPSNWHGGHPNNWHDNHDDNYYHGHRYGGGTVFVPTPIYYPSYDETYITNIPDQSLNPNVPLYIRDQFGNLIDDCPPYNSHTITQIIENGRLIGYNEVCQI